MEAETRGVALSSGAQPPVAALVATVATSSRGSCWGFGALREAVLFLFSVGTFNL